MPRTGRKHRRTYANRAAPGICVWCDTALPLRPDGKVNKRLRWHEACVQEYRIANFSADQRRYVLKASGGVCGGCRHHYEERPVLIREPNASLMGADGPHSVLRFEVGYEADHIVPLWSVDPDDPESFKFWTKDNLQLLCLPCHKAKSKREAAERAKMKRIRAKLLRPKRKKVRHDARLLRHLGA